MIFQSLETFLVFGNLHLLNQQPNRPVPRISFSQAKVFDYLENNGLDKPEEADMYYSFLSPDHKLACFYADTYIAVFCSRSGELQWIHTYKSRLRFKPQFHPTGSLLVWQATTVAGSDMAELCIADVSAIGNTAMTIPNAYSSKNCH
jgi:hypothetical protein